MKKHFILFLVLPFLTSCIEYAESLKAPTNSNDDLLLNEQKDYKFTTIPSKEDLNKIDTSAYYVQVFEGRYYNEQEKDDPRVLIFDSDGHFMRTSIKNFYYHKKQNRPKNSVRYGGKYRISENLIELEAYYPSSGGRASYYIRGVKKGEITEDRLVFKDGSNHQEIYEKKYSLD